jgi:murein DD-endopeptidase MepM/ murein hydrolase activator NlpD
MKSLFIFFVLFTFFSASAQLPDAQIRALKGGYVKPDTSYIYRLPFAKGSKFLLIQAYNSKMSHKNELSLDFKMRKGSKVCAARDGIVVAVKNDSEVGGLKDEYLSQGNHIIIVHSDGSQAMYWHLQHNGTLVSVGDSVKRGQHIGYSGNTGFTAFPHLHFQVQDKDGNDIATRFNTKKAVIYLRPAKWYRAVE